MVGEYSHKISSPRQMSRRAVRVSRAGPVWVTHALHLGLVEALWLHL